MKIFVPAFIALSLCDVAYAAPAKPKIAVKPKVKIEIEIEIDAKARAVFARAIGFYRNAQGLRVEWRQVEEWRTLKATLDFDRAGRARIVERWRDWHKLVVFDGKNQWTLDEIGSADKEITYSNETFDPKLARKEALSILGWSEVPDTVRYFLTNTSPLDASEVQHQIDGLNLLEFRATLLAPQPFGGQACDLARISMISFQGGERVAIQRTYWIARRDGRLMRWQQRVSDVGKKGEGNKSDAQISAQALNPKFAPETFKFTPPKGAVLSKY